MKQYLDFNTADKTGDSIRIKATIDGLLPNGNTGYHVQVWSTISSDHQKPLSIFTIDFMGKLYKWRTDENVEYFHDKGVVEKILSEGRPTLLIY